MSNIFTIKDFVDEQTIQELNAWVDEGVKNKWLDYGYNNSPSLYTKRVNSRYYSDRYSYPQVVYDVSKKITERLQIDDLPLFFFGGGKDGIVVSCTFPDGEVASHIDNTDGSCHVLRCNILSRAADRGGHLIMNGQKIDIEVGELHCYLASDNEHSVNTVEGTTSRVLWMFGYECSKDKFDQLLGEVNDIATAN